MEFTLREGIRLQTLALETRDAFPESIVIVLLTQQGNYYHYNTTMEGLDPTAERIVAELADRDDTAVCALLCLFETGGVSPAPGSLRQKLIALNESNRSAWQFMPGLRPLGDC